MIGRGIASRGWWPPVWWDARKTHRPRGLLQYFCSTFAVLLQVISILEDGDLSRTSGEEQEQEQKWFKFPISKFLGQGSKDGMKLLLEIERQSKPVRYEQMIPRISVLLYFVPTTEEETLLFSQCT